MEAWTDETAQWYADHYGEYATNRLAIDQIELAPDAVVVDVGCGTGAALRHASLSVTQGVLIGVDPVPRMLDIAKERLEDHAGADRIEFRQGSADALPVEDHTVDVLFALDSFDHWGGPQQHDKGLREVRRALRPNGRFVVVKDCDSPGGVTTSKHNFLKALARNQWSVVHEHNIAQDGVVFTMWVCQADASQPPTKEAADG